MLSAALVAPLVTPIIALPALAWFSNLGTAGGYFYIAIPVVLAFSVAFGYVGMLFVCLPLVAVLTLLKRLSAPILCGLTSVVGACLWAWFELNPMQPVGNSLVVGFLCSLGVAMVFCYLAGIGMRARAGAVGDSA